MKPLYIFDLDGTLADIRHRRHYVDGPKVDWSAFYRACSKDAPNMPVLLTLEAMWRFGAEIWIWSGRSDEVRELTLDWLHEYTPFSMDELDKILRMRRAGDYTPDHELKKTWYDALLLRDKRRLVAVFDDRNRMVEMWRSLHVSCFQVAPGDF